MAASRKKTASRAPTGRQLVIVESPAKARTITRFLGDEFRVLASIGHVRDLPTSRTGLPKDKADNKYARLGVDLDNDFEPIYVVPPEKKPQIAAIKASLKDAPVLWLATDEDREGESISWHLVEVLKPKVPVRRLVFHEITRGAILEALEHPREIDENLVRAQESRRILDRLFGYEVSPVLWRKIRPRLSAGRVQSVALRILVDREFERINFHASEYWDLAGTFAPADEGDAAAPFDALLRRLGGDRVASGRDFDPDTGKLSAEGVRVLDEAGARALVERLGDETAEVLEVEEKPYRQRPSAPFTTSTLQQEAGRKLRFPARRTMRVAQGLYENGLITYMRTDSTALSDQAVTAARALIGEQYGKGYLPDAPRVYRTNVKNAQEAHEAIRPAGSRFTPMDVVRAEHGADAARLYELIWKRTVASQMTDARGKQVTVRVGLADAVFNASGKTIEFAGFRRAYVEGSDDPEADLAEAERILPPLRPGQRLRTVALAANGHTTQPPARYTEASLVKALDTRGIGRPSTWASIIQLLLDREYAFKKGTALVPSYTAFAVVRMLTENFGQVLDYGFTASMEDDLDAISRGELDPVTYLRHFYLGDGRPGLRELVQSGIDQVDPRKVCAFEIGRSGDRVVEVRVGKFGLFVSDGTQNASLPEDTVPDELTLEHALGLLDAAARGPQALGTDPATGESIYLRTGRFGPYVQRGEVVEGSKEKPKMVSLLPGMEPETLDLATALSLLELPRDLGMHPRSAEGEHVFAHLGRYGPYVKCGKESRSIPADVHLLEIDLARAVALLEEPRRGRGQREPAAPLKELGVHPETGATIKVLPGRYGPYVTDGTLNASLPKSIEPEALSLGDAVELLRRRAERIAAGGGRGRRNAPKKKVAKKKATTGKAPKKKAPKKKAAKKKVAGKKAAKKKAAAKKAPAKRAAPDPDEG